MAAKRMPTTRDITVEIVKLINFDPRAAAYRINAESSMEINIVAKDSTNYYIWGNVVSEDVPAFADQ